MLLGNIRYHRLRTIAYATSTSLVGFFISISSVRADEYPVILTATAVRELGIAHFGYGAMPFENKCYYYGDGGYSISISDRFLTRLRSRGFTLQSACLGLVSQTRYDPETGRRLPTYIIADPKSIGNIARELRTKGALGGEWYGRDETSDELPLDMPDCFRNGNPYTDCKFRFGRMSGKALSSAETELYARLGVALDEGARTLISRSTSKAGHEFFDKERKFIESDEGVPEIVGSMTRAGDSLSYELAIDKPYSSATFWARSPSFPRGYGYALDASGGAGPVLPASTLKEVVDRSSHSQLSVDELRRRLDAR